MSSRLVLEVNEEDTQLLERILGSSRFVWNLFLSEAMANYRDGFIPTADENIATLDAILLLDDYSWLSATPIITLRQTIRHLETTMEPLVYKGVQRFPRYQTKRADTQYIDLGPIDYDSIISYIDERYYLNICGVPILISGNFIPKAFTYCKIIKEYGTWYVSFTNPEIVIVKTYYGAKRIVPRTVE